jgi:DNA repair exonuclease SbcCD nuclease subunit
VVYPGAIQGLNITEKGRKGCYLVEVDQVGSVELSFQALDSVRWVEAEVDIHEQPSLDRLEDAILTAMESKRQEAGDRGLICRVRLTGRGAMHGSLSGEDSQDELLQRLREHWSAAEPFVWIKDVRVETAPDVDLESRRQQQDFLGEVLQQAEAFRNRQDLPEALQQEVLSELFGHRRAGKHLQGLSQEEAEELLRRAELLCADRLEPGGEG